MLHIPFDTKAIDYLKNIIYLGTAQFMNSTEKIILLSAYILMLIWF